MQAQSLFTHTDGHRYIAFTTYRKNGNPVMTPVWFVQKGEKLYIWTAQDSGKAKRLRNQPCVQLGPSNHSGKLLGAVTEGMARFVPSSEFDSLEKAFKAKYGWQVRLFALLWKLQGHQHTYIEVSPQ